MLKAYLERRDAVLKELRGLRNEAAILGLDREAAFIQAATAAITCSVLREDKSDV